MTRWEYLTMELDTGLVMQGLTRATRDRVNAAGADGWEAVGIVSLGRGNVTVLFKRPLHDTGDEHR